MKCQRCKGKGKLEYPGFPGRYCQCPKCYGTGEVKKTNLKNVTSSPKRYLYTKGLQQSEETD